MFVPTRVVTAAGSGFTCTWGLIRALLGLVEGLTGLVGLVEGLTGLVQVVS